MEIYLHDQWKALWIAILLGIAFGAAYDVLRISRIFIGVRYFGARSVGQFLTKAPALLGRSKRVSDFRAACGIKSRAKHRTPESDKAQTKRNSRIASLAISTAVFFGDLLYFLITGAAFCVYIHYSGGEFRLFMLVSLTLGFVLYYFTAGRAVICISEYIVRFLRVSFSWAAYFLFRPIMLSILIADGIFFYVFNKIVLISRKLCDIIYCKRFSAHKKKISENALLADLPK